MLQTIKQFFEDNFAEKKQSKPLEEQLNLAAAALLVEVSYADHDIAEPEKQALMKSLERHFHIEPQLVEQIMKLAEDEVRDAHCSFEFTRLINAYFEAEQKFLLVQSMWSVAYADGKLDRFEEAMIRKLADLLYVPHSDFIRAKLTAEKPAKVSK